MLVRFLAINKQLNGIYFELVHYLTNNFVGLPNFLSCLVYYNPEYTYFSEKNYSKIQLSTNTCIVTWKI